MAYIPIPQIPSIPITGIPIIDSKVAAKIEQAERYVAENLAKVEAKYRKELAIIAILQGLPAPSNLKGYGQQLALDTALDLKSAGFSMLKSLANISPQMIATEVEKMKAEAIARGEKPPIKVDKKQVAERIAKEKLAQLEEQIKWELEKLKNPAFLPTGQAIKIPRLPDIPSIPRIPFVI